MRLSRLIQTALAVSFFLGCASTGNVVAQDAPRYQPMAVFEGLDGKTFRGEGAGPDGAPIIDIAKWQTILGGRAFQSTHRLEDGSYGGRTIFFYDEDAKEYIFHYFTTAGFHTTGTATPTRDGFMVIEQVRGHPKYVEVRSEIAIGEGSMRVASRHKDKNGVFTDGEVMIYHEIEDPGPLFFDEADALFGKRTTIKDAHDRYEDKD